MARRVLVLFITLSLLLVNQAEAIYRDSVLVMVSRTGYEIDVVEPGRYVVVRNFSGQKVVGKFRILDHRTIAVGKTVVPLHNIKSLTVKSSMYPVSRWIYKAGKFLVIDFVKKMFAKLGFSNTGPAAILLLFIVLLVAVVFVVLGLLLMLISLPGLLVGKTYDIRHWKFYIKPRR